MPKVSREHIANVDDHGLVEDRHEDVEGTTIQFVTIREDVDATPMLRGLPNDTCPCPHWGYVFKGKLVFRVGDREEVFGPAMPSISHPATSRPRRPAPSTSSSARPRSCRSCPR